MLLTYGSKKLNMRLIVILAAAFISICSTSFYNDGWENLLDRKMRKWETYLSYRIKPGYNGRIPKNDDGTDQKPAGYNNDEAGVFSILPGNEPILRISGEIYGCAYTKKEYQNYHLKLMVKWGTKKWDPRLNEPKDSGVIYHSIGKAGVDYWHAWMLGQELQIMEGGCGDYWCISSSAGYINTKASPAKKDTMVYSPDGVKTFMGAGNNFVQQSHNYENAGDEWNTIELICFGDKSIHLVNGHVVMALSGSSYKDGAVFKPLTKGRLQLQSEAAEVFYKNVMIKPIKVVPNQYAAYFK